MKLKFGDEEEENEYVSKLRDAEELSGTEETRALFYGQGEIIDDLPQNLSALEGYRDGENIDLDSSNSLRRYIGVIKSQERRINTADIIVGISILDLVSYEHSTDETYIDTPHFFASRNCFKDILSEKVSDERNLREVNKVSEPVKSPQRVYFCSHHEELSESQKKRLESKINNIRYLRLGPNYQIMEKSAMVHGPMLEESKEEDYIGKIIDLSETDIEFVSRQAVEFHAHSEHVEQVDENVFQASIKEIWSDEVLEQYEERYEISEDNHHIIVTTGEEHLLISYTHNFYNDYALSKIAELEKTLRQKTDAEIHRSSTYPVEPSESEEKKWVIDTNTLYLQDREDKPRSLANFFFSTRIALHKEIIIPWQVLAEINRHKDQEAEKTNIKSSTIENGVDNIRTLKILDKTGFIELNIEDTPESIDESISKKEGITDLAILRKAEEENAKLITGDQELLELAELKGTDTYNILRYVEEIEGEKGNVSDIQEEVMNVLKEEQKGKEKILDAIEKEIERKGMGENEKNPESILKGLFNSKEVIEVPIKKSSDLEVAISKEYKVVPTRNFVESIDQRISQVGGEKYLNDKFLREFKKGTGLTGPFKPKLEFLIPEDYLLSEERNNDEITEFWKKLHTITEIKNAGYSSISSAEIKSQTDLSKKALKSARQNDAILLCGDKEKLISRASKILEMRVFSC